MFKQYMHVEKFGNEEVENIELGKVYVFPKIDGTNASVWWEEGRLRCGSRTRELDTVNFQQDNADFAKSMYHPKFEPIREFIARFSSYRLFGEWLVPHTFTGYRQEAWRRFYIFDIMNDETGEYLPYEICQSLLEENKLDYIPPLATIKNGDYGKFLDFLDKNLFLCPDGGTPGEGIVIKNYDFYNKFGLQIWAKLIRQEFKDKHHAIMGAPEINTGLMNEERVLNKVMTDHFVNKTYDKIRVERGGWSSKCIPELFGRCYYDIIKEELWDSLKEIDYGTINFKTLKALMIRKIKELKPEIFS